MSISEVPRTLVLGVLAAIGVGGVIVDSVLRSKDAPPPAASPALSATPATPVLPGAPPGDLASLQKRYRPIVLKGPFKTRDFKPRSKPRPRVRSEDKSPEATQSYKKPGEILLRLTSLIGEGKARVGLFEERGTGTALFAAAGKTLAGVSVASVGSDRVVVRLKGKERTLAIGESFTLPASARSVLEPLRPAGSVRTESKPVTGETKIPVLSEKKRLSVLERLKARRRASKARASGKPVPEAPKDEAPKDEAPKKDSPKRDLPQDGSGKPKKAGESAKSGEPAKDSEPKTPDSTPARSGAEADGPEGPEDGDQPEGEESEGPEEDPPEGDQPEGDQPEGDEPEGDQSSTDEPSEAPSEGAGQGESDDTPSEGEDMAEAESSTPEQGTEPKEGNQ